MANNSFYDKPLLYCTVGELIQALKEGMGVDPIEEEINNEKDFAPSLHLCTGIKSLAKFLDCHYNTAQKLYASGVLDPAVYRNGKLIIFNKDLVLAILQTKHRTNNKPKNIKAKCRQEKR